MKKYLLLTLFLSITVSASYKKTTHPFIKIPTGVSVKKLHKSPDIFFLTDFITKKEADHMQELASTRMKRSTVEDGQINEARTSLSAMFSNNEDTIVKAIVCRVAEMIDYPVSHVEGLQVVWYKKGQEFKPHYDFFLKEMKEKNKAQRLKTFFIYMNDLEDSAGGQTIFPELDLKVSPKKYAALYWSNVDTEGKEDFRTLHGGAPVTKGEKWAINVWIRDKPFG